MVSAGSPLKFVAGRPIVAVWLFTAFGIGLWAVLAAVGANSETSFVVNGAFEVAWLCLAFYAGWRRGFWFALVLPAAAIYFLLGITLACALGSDCL